jgi:predicted ATPase
MITSVTIDNFKSLRHQAIDLERLTVFVGANASGKTSVLEAMHLAVRAAVGEPERVFGYERHCDWLYTRGGSGDLSIACTTSGGTFSIAATPPARFPPQQADTLGTGRWTFQVLPSDHAILDNALRPARSMVFLHLNATRLARSAYSDRAPPRVEHDGEGLASVLAYMALNDPDGFEALVEEMRKLIPHLRRIRFRKVLVRRIEKEYVRIGDDTVVRRSPRDYQGDSILFDFQNANSVSASTVSEGTLMLLGLLTVLLGPNQPKILLMDDIEHGLHPLAQKTLLDVLRQVMRRFPDLQIVASAHSPYLLDELRPEEIRLMTISEDGCSACGRLTDHPQFEKWKEEMAPGEMWSMFGERWLVSEGAAR